MRFVKSFMVTFSLFVGVSIAVLGVAALYFTIEPLVEIWFEWWDWRYWTVVFVFAFMWYVVHTGLYREDCQGESVGSEKNAVRQDDETAGG